MLFFYFFLAVVHTYIQNIHSAHNSFMWILWACVFVCVSVTLLCSQALPLYFCTREVATQLYRALFSFSLLFNQQSNLKETFFPIAHISVRETQTSSQHFVVHTLIYTTNSTQVSLQCNAKCNVRILFGVSWVARCCWKRVKARTSLRKPTKHSLGLVICTKAKAFI